VKNRNAVAAAALALSLAGCAASTHATQPSTLGSPHGSADLFAVLEQPGPVEVESIVSTEWAIARKGLINLDAPKAKAAGLKNEDEPIQVFFHVIRHPKFGSFIIDTGVERALRDAPDTAAMRGLVAKEMHIERMGFQLPLGDWLARQREPLRGVFFTHLHVDHVSGAQDLPKTTPLYAGPGETTPRAFVNVFLQPNIDRALEGLPPINEWRFQPDADGRFAGVVDVFGDGSFWALWTPGHTPGSTAYLARTARGPVLFTGDTCHTRWGWENDVEPGEFTADHAQNAESLARLRRLVREHPTIDVRLGHQRLTAASAPPASAPPASAPPASAPPAGAPPAAP
jgi:glyoxylase-like metal-dependent hydrolase (beta-lactamase superfamily II)